MTEAIGPGDWVECINNTHSVGLRPTDPTPIQVGALYQVKGLERVISINHSHYSSHLTLVGVKSPRGNDWTFCPCRFRPIYRPKASTILALKQPSPELEPA